MQKKYIIPATDIQLLSMNGVICVSAQNVHETIGVATGTKSDFIGD